MNVYFVVNRPHDWPLEIPGVMVISARAYLTEAGYAEQRSARVVNLCRSKRYASRGYYVSLLAEARGHRPLPGVKAIEDLQTQDPSHLLFGSFRDQLQQALASQSGDSLTVTAYFPSGETARMLPAPASRRHRVCLPVATSHKRIPWLSLCVARVFPSGEKVAPARKGSEWREYRADRRGRCGCLA